MWRILKNIIASAAAYSIVAGGLKFYSFPEIPWTAAIAPAVLIYLGILAFAIAFLLLFRRSPQHLRAFCWVGRHDYGEPSWSPTGFHQVCGRCGAVKPRPDLDEARRERRRPRNDHGA